MKYIFFDIDGTLVYDNNGEECIPNSTIKTIKTLKENGHIMAIASGRSMQTVEPVAKKLGIDNIVSDGGNGLMIHGEVMHIKPLDHDLVLKVCEELLEKKIPFAFMIDRSLHLHATPVMMQHLTKIGFERFKVVLDEKFDYKKAAPSKIFIGLKKGQEDLLESIDAHKIMRYVDDCIAFEPDDKYSGVKELVIRKQGNLEDIIFFGDGMNDIGMFENVPLSIAMGNAIDKLKEMAHFVTKNIEDDGIEYACKHLGLID